MRKIMLLCTVACACAIPAVGNSSNDRSIKEDMRAMHREELIAYNGYVFGKTVLEVQTMASIMFYNGGIITLKEHGYPVAVEQDVRRGAKRVTTGRYDAACVANVWLEKKPCFPGGIVHDAIYTERPRAVAAKP